jgi:hypothetical protein
MTGAILVGTGILFIFFTGFAFEEAFRLGVVAKVSIIEY